MADRFGPPVAQRAAMACTALAFVIYFAGPISMLALILGVVVMDLGVRAGHLALQAEVFSLQEDARSRLNGLYMFCRFAGGAAGSMTGAWSWHIFG